MRGPHAIEANPRVIASIEHVVRTVATERGVPPAYVTAHIRGPAVDEARKEVWRWLIVDLRMQRGLVAKVFGRHHRRVRRSVLGF
jgi:hypothetical protein